MFRRLRVNSKTTSRNYNTASRSLVILRKDVSSVGPKLYRQHGSYSTLMSSSAYCFTFFPTFSLFLSFIPHPFLYQMLVYVLFYHLSLFFNRGSSLLPYNQASSYVSDCEHAITKAWTLAAALGYACLYIIYIYMFCVCSYVCMYAYIHVCMYVCVCVYSFFGQMLMNVWIRSRKYDFLGRVHILVMYLGYPFYLLPNYYLSIYPHTYIYIYILSVCIASFFSCRKIEDSASLLRLTLRHRGAFSFLLRFFSPIDICSFASA